MTATPQPGHDAAIVQAVLGLPMRLKAHRAARGLSLRDQELAVITAAKKEAQRVAAAKANCVRWHGKDCGCWTKVIDE